MYFCFADALVDYYNYYRSKISEEEEFGSKFKFYDVLGSVVISCACAVIWDALLSRGGAGKLKKIYIFLSLCLKHYFYVHVCNSRRDIDTGRCSSSNKPHAMRHDGVVQRSPVC